MPNENKQAAVPPRGGHAGPGKRFAPHEKPKNTKGTFLRLVRLYGAQWQAIAVCVLLTVTDAAVTLSVPYLIGQAVNTFDIASGVLHQNALYTTVLLLLLAYAASYITRTVSGYLMVGVSQNLVKTMRTSLFTKLQRLPLLFYDTRPHGDTMSRLTNDVDNISSTIAQTTTELISSLLTIAGSLVMMLSLSPPLTLAAVVSLPLVLGLTRTIAKRSRAAFLGQQRALGNLNGIVEESVTGLKMVKAFGQEKRMLDGFAQTNAELTRFSIRAMVWAGALMPMMNVINNLSFSLVACMGGVLTVRGLVSVGVIASFITYSRQFAQPLNNIADLFNSIQSALAGAERVFEVMDEAEETADKPDAIELPHPKGAVTFANVQFGYTPGRPVLEGISFHVPPGGVAALVGETGAGKTTIVNLLTRFYDTDTGTICIDGADIRHITRASLRQCFSVVLQDTSLFSGTIADNIRYGCPSASMEQVQNAAKAAGAHDFISRLPRGYDTPVSGSADTLSQGQRQLLSIARAFLTDAPILILDEATSSVDTRTEQNIQRAMVRLRENRTCFLIAHRLSTIRDADEILVIGGGKILERGTHDTLMHLQGAYYQMVKS